MIFLLLNKTNDNESITIENIKTELIPWNNKYICLLYILQSGAGETYKMTEKLSSYKASSNYTSSDDTRPSPSYPTAKRISSPGKESIKNYCYARYILFIYRFIYL